jgi:uncharacterized protein YjdB
MDQSTATGRRLARVGSLLLIPLLAVFGACQDVPVNPDAASFDPRMATSSTTSSCMVATASDSTLLVGDSARLSAVRFRNGKSTAVTPVWTSSNPSIVSIAGSTARALRSGAVILMATLSSCNATVPMVVSDRTPTDTTPPPPVAVATVSVSPTAPSLVVGTTQQLSASARDAAGNTLTGRTVTWSSSAPAVASVSATGLVTAVAAGSAAVTATVEGIAATATVTVTPVPVATVSVSPATASLVVGGTQQLTASARDAAGNTLTGRPVTWSSSSAAVASVSANGGVTAVAAGSAVVTATVEGIAATAAVTVTQVPVATVSVSPTTASLVVGGTQQMTASARDAAGTVLTGRPVTWSSSSAAVASVSAGGLVTAVAAGSAVVTATVEGKSASAAITVATPPPTSSKQLALQLTVFDQAATTPLSSNGIPLPKGYLFERDLATTALWDGTREVPRVLQALAGRYSDGSLRSVLLQYQASPATPAMRLFVGATRTVTDPAPWPIPSGTPQAVTYPQDPAFLIGTGIVGPTISVAENAPFVIYENQFRTFAEQHWQATGAQWETSNYYDRASNHFAYWMRSGELEYWKRAVALALNYRVQYLQGSGFNPSPHWMALEGVALHYWLTGDPASRTAVVNSAGRATAAFSPGALASPTGEYIEGRIQARMLLASLLAWELGDTSDSWGTKTTAYATNIMTLQRTDGGYSWPNWCNRQGNFMVGLQNDALIKYYERHTANPAVVTTIRKAVDYLHRTSWRPASRAFTYMDVQCTGPDDQLPTPDLNMLIVNGFAFVGRQTGDRRYVAVADSVADGAVAGTWLAGSKQFNQQYYDSHQYLWYRR